MATERDELEAALDGLYRVFAAYVRPQSFYGCECCWGGRGSVPVTEGVHGGQVLVPAPGGTRDLRTLTADELADVAAEVPLTAGTLDVFKSYLPRIVEIALGDGFEWPDLEIVTGRLSNGEDVGCRPWTEWPPAEVEAIRSVLHAFWRDRIAHEEDEHTIDDALCAVGLADPDIDWYLSEWLRFEHPTAACNFERFLQLNIGDVARRGRLWNAYWETDDPPARQNVARIVEWLRAPATAEAVAAAADRARSEDERAALSECYLRWLPTIPQTV